MADVSVVCGFVVASSDRTRFRFWGDYGPGWTEDRKVALHFARREDAESFAKEDEDAWLILPSCVETVEEQPAPPAGMRLEIGADVLAALVSAVEFYGNPENWFVQDVGGLGYHKMGDGSMERDAGRVGVVSKHPQGIHPHFHNDAGSRAAAALKKYEAHRASVKRAEHSTVQVPRQYLADMERARRIPAGFWPEVMKWLR